jgi:hypothetical protein
MEYLPMQQMKENTRMVNVLDNGLLEKKAKLCNYDYRLVGEDNMMNMDKNMVFGLNYINIIVTYSINFIIKVFI